MKKCFKILFPLLAIVGVLFSFLVPVSADTPVYNGDYYSIFSDNSPFSFVGSDEYFVKDQTSIRSIGDCSGMSCLFFPGDGFSLSYDKDFTVHVVFSSSMPFTFGFLKQDNNGDIWFYNCFSYNPTSGTLIWLNSNGNASNYSVPSSVSFTYKVDFKNSYVYFELPPLTSQNGSYFSRYSKVCVSNSSEAFDARPFFLFTPTSSSQTFVFEDFSYFNRNIVYNVSVAHYLLSYGFQSGSVSGYASGYDAGESVGYSSGRADGYNSGYADGSDAAYDPAYGAGYDSGFEHGFFSGQADGFSSGQAYGEALHTNDYENGYNAGLISDTNVLTDTVDGVFDGLLSTIGVLNGFSIFGITLGGVLSVAAILLLVFFVLKVIRK